MIDTPDSEVVGRSVQAVKGRYYPNSLFATGTKLELDLSGEAVVANLGGGRYRFALSGNGASALGVYRDLGAAEGFPRCRRAGGQAAAISADQSGQAAAGDV